MVVSLLQIKRPKEAADFGVTSYLKSMLLYLWMDFQYLALLIKTVIYITYA